MLISFRLEPRVVSTGLTRLGRQCLADAGSTAEENRKTAAFAVDEVAEAVLVLDLALDKGEDQVLVSVGEHQVVKRPGVKLDLVDVVDGVVVWQTVSITHVVRPMATYPTIES